MEPLVLEGPNGPGNTSSTTPGGRPDADGVATRMALTETVLSPRFYTTDFDAMDKINIEPVRKQWDEMMAEFHADPNRGHFTRTSEFVEFDIS